MWRRRGQTNSQWGHACSHDPASAIAADSQPVFLVYPVFENASCMARLPIPGTHRYEQLTSGVYGSKAIQDSLKYFSSPSGTITFSV